MLIDLLFMFGSHENIHMEQFIRHFVYFQMYSFIEFALSLMEHTQTETYMMCLIKKLRRKKKDTHTHTHTNIIIIGNEFSMPMLLD